MKKTKKTLKRKLDKLVSEIIRKRGKCEHCGKNIKLQVAHVFSRTYNSTRFYSDNLLCLCASCHWFFHKNPVLFGEWVKKHLGKKKYENLKRKKEQIKKWIIQELEEIYKKLKTSSTI